jgi:quinol monooxygenase YgiN
VAIFRRMIAAAAAAVLLAAPAVAADKPAYGLMGRIIAKPGQRDALIAILLEGSNAMPGCRSYIVAKDNKDDNAIWVTEVWDSKESHAASLKLPSVQTAISKGRPLIAGFDNYTETIVVGGVGLVL